MRLSRRARSKACGKSITTGIMAGTKDAAAMAITMSTITSTKDAAAMAMSTSTITSMKDAAAMDIMTGTIMIMKDAVSMSIIMRTRCLQAGGRRRLTSIQRKNWIFLLRHCRPQKDMGLSCVRKGSCRWQTEHGSSSILSRRNMKCVTLRLTMRAGCA